MLLPFGGEDLSVGFRTKKVLPTYRVCDRAILALSSGTLSEFAVTSALALVAVRLFC